jgi:hypothetical protein
MPQSAAQGPRQRFRKPRGGENDQICPGERATRAMRGLHSPQVLSSPISASFASRSQVYLMKFSLQVGRKERSGEMLALGLALAQHDPQRSGRSLKLDCEGYPGMGPLVSSFYVSHSFSPRSEFGPVERHHGVQMNVRADVHLTVQLCVLEKRLSIRREQAV